MLRVLRQQCGSEIKGVQDPSSVWRQSLDDHFSGHFWMDRAEIGILAGLCERERKLFVSIKYFGLEHFFRADDGMWDVVAIDPRNGCSHGHGDGRRTERKIINFHISR